MSFATYVCVVAVVLLLHAERTRASTLRAIAKPIASLSFIAVGLMTLALCVSSVPHWGDYQGLILLGLVLGAVGDVALLGKSSRAFLVGLGAFLLGHIAYIVAFAQLAPPSSWLAAPAFVPILVGGAVLAYLWPRLGNMRVPVIAYVIAIVTMMIAAIAVARVPVIPASNRTLLALGAALFFASDFAVARDKFVGASFVNRAWGLPTYYAGQLLIAWSMQIPQCP